MLCCRCTHTPPRTCTPLGSIHGHGGAPVQHTVPRRAVRGGKIYFAHSVSVTLTATRRAAPFVRRAIHPYRARRSRASHRWSHTSTTTHCTGWQDVVAAESALDCMAAWGSPAAVRPAPGAGPARGRGVAAGGDIEREISQKQEMERTHTKREHMHDTIFTPRLHPTSPTDTHSGGPLKYTA